MVTSHSRALKTLSSSGTVSSMNCFDVNDTRQIFAFHWAGKRFALGFCILLGAIVKEKLPTFPEFGIVPEVLDTGRD